MSRILKTAGRGSGLGVGVLSVGLGLTCASPALAQPVVYVDVGATGANDGSSWTDAYADLQAALDAAETSGGLIWEIWVADGTYKPSKRTDPDDPRSATFQLLDGISLYGGFAGTEATIDERNIDEYPTILSGDFNGDDEPDFVNYDENARHVLTALGSVEPRTAVIDGLTIVSGYALSTYSSDARGGALYLQTPYATVSNCTFSHNFAGTVPSNVAHSSGGGAAVYAYSSSFYNCRFIDNKTIGTGAGVFLFSGDATFTDCFFQNNIARSGGAIGTESASSVTLVSSVFLNNTADTGGALGGSRLSLVIKGCRFEGNAAIGGGAMFLDRGTGVTIRESVFVNNSAESGYGGALRVYSFGLVELIDCEFRSNSAEYAGGVHLSGFGSAIVLQCMFLDNKANEGEGGGLFVYGRGMAGVTDCTFVGNFATESGGGLFAESGEVNLTHCRFESNDAVIGGAVSVDDFAAVTIEQCRIESNRALMGGGVAALWPESQTRIVNSLVVENRASAHGGGIAVGSGPFAVENCTIANNTSGALGAGMIVGHYATVTNSIVWGNVVDPQGGDWTDEVAQIEGIEFAAINYSDIEGWSGAYGGDANFGLDPLFVEPIDPDGPYELGEPDFHLRPDSPCINAGLTETIDWGPWEPPPLNLDLDGKPRVLCKAVDMGAYESGLAGDVDCDHDVDMTDFSGWSACMGGPGAIAPFPNCSAFDFDGDEDVDLADFAKFSRAFSPGSP